MVVTSKSRSAQISYPLFEKNDEFIIGMQKMPGCKKIRFNAINTERVGGDCLEPFWFRPVVVRN